MSTRNVYTATEARQNFFELLNLAEKGKEPIIVKKDRNLKFRLTLVKEKSAAEKKRALDEISNMNIHLGQWEDLKKIIETRYDS